MKLADLYFQFKSDIQEIEEALEAALGSRDSFLYQTSSHILKAGGKRIRPVFVLLSGCFGEYDLSRMKKIAVPLELIHMATLVHDDVVDDADKRRGMETVKAKWDDKVAMYTGDFLLAKALMIVSELDDARIHRVLSKAIVEMCIGEIEQVRDIHNWDHGLRQYLRRIKRKTALLIAVSCELGARVGRAEEETVRALAHFGYDVGMAFQITDDILDFTGTEKTLGKPAGSDMRQGNITLPALYALHCSPVGDDLRRWIDRPQEERKVSEAVRLIRKSGGIEYARDLANRYLQRAEQRLEPLPNSKSKRSLLDIARFIGERRF